MLILVTTTAATPDFGTVDQSLQELTDMDREHNDLLPGTTCASTEMPHLKYANSPIPKQGS